MKHGRNLVILKDGVAIAAAKSCDVSMDVDTKEISTPASSQDKIFIAARHGWSVSVSVLVTQLEGMLLEVGETYTLTFAIDSTTVMSGEAFVNEVEIEAQRGNIIQGGISFKGTSSLTTA